MQRKLLVLGMKNASTQFQRMMDWVLRDIPNTHPYIYDIIVGSDGETVEELTENHTKDIRRVLKTLTDNLLTCITTALLCITCITPKGKWSSLAMLFEKRCASHPLEFCLPLQK